MTKCDRGRGSKLVKNRLTYFMEGPYRLGDFSAVSYRPIVYNSQFYQNVDFYPTSIP